MYNGTLIEDLGKTVAKADHLDPVTERIAVPSSLPDFMSFEECRAEAEKQMAKDYPEDGPMPGRDMKQFAITFATFVAWTCAAEATRRRR